MRRRYQWYFLWEIKVMMIKHKCAMHFVTKTMIFHGKMSKENLTTICIFIIASNTLLRLSITVKLAKKSYMLKHASSVLPSILPLLKVLLHLKIQNWIGEILEMLHHTSIMFFIFKYNKAREQCYVLILLTKRQINKWALYVKKERLC